VTTVKILINRTWHIEVVAACENLYGISAARVHTPENDIVIAHLARVAKKRTSDALEIEVYRAGAPGTWYTRYANGYMTWGEDVCCFLESMYEEIIEQCIVL